jgi:hypothetical protein
MHYILFKWARVTVVPQAVNPFLPGSVTCIPQMVMEGEEWKEPQQQQQSATREVFQFVAQVHSPKEVADLVRQDPLTRHILFHGQITELKVPIAVLLDGKSLDSLDSEWSEPKDDEL